jgi:hypothetical protein
MPCTEHVTGRIHEFKWHLIGFMYCPDIYMRENLDISQPEWPIPGFY